MMIENIGLYVWELLDIKFESKAGYVNSIQLESEKSSDCRMYILIASDRKYHFLIEADNKILSEVSKFETNELHIDFVSNYSIGKMKGFNTANFINLSCNGQDYLNIFTEIIKEIATLIFDGAYSKLEAVSSVLSKWKNFWNKKTGERLSEQEIIGLIGELYFLRLSSEFRNESIESWTGPLGGKNDFHFDGNLFFEVKCTNNTYHIHKINGVEQLDFSPDLDLYLFSMLLHISVDGKSPEISLESLIKDIHKKFIGQYQKIEIFYEKLYLLGYRIEHKDYYMEKKFNIIDTKLYQVNSSFPAITPSSFKQEISERVSRVSYFVDCTGLSDTNIEDAFF